MGLLPVVPTKNVGHIFHKSTAPLNVRISRNLPSSSLFFAEFDDLFCVVGEFVYVG